MEKPEKLADVVDGKEDLLRRCDIVRHAEELAAAAATQGKLSRGLTAGDLWVLPVVCQALQQAMSCQADSLRRWAAEAEPWDVLLARSLRRLSASLAAVAAEASEVERLADELTASAMEQARGGPATARA